MYYSYRITNFTLDTSLPINTGSSLELALISPQNKRMQERECVWWREPFIDRWLIHLVILVIKKVCILFFLQLISRLKFLSLQQVKLMKDLDESCNINTV